MCCLISGYARCVGGRVARHSKASGYRHTPENGLQRHYCWESYGQRLKTEDIWLSLIVKKGFSPWKRRGFILRRGNAFHGGDSHRCPAVCGRQVESCVICRACLYGLLYGIGYGSVSSLTKERLKRRVLNLVGQIFRLIHLCKQFQGGHALAGGSESQVTST